MATQEEVPRPVRRRTSRARTQDGRLPHEAEEEDEERDAYLDLETESWDRYVLGGLLTPEGSVSLAWHDEEEGEDALVEEALALGPGAVVYTWNGGRYDLLWFLEHARKRDVTCSIGLAGSRITRIAVKGGPVFRDAFAVAPMALAKASAIAGVPLVKSTGLRCTCPERCGGYCRIRRDGMTKRERGALESYLRRDLETTRAVVRALKAEAGRCGYVLKGTVGGTAYATAKKVCGFADAEWSPESYHLARSGYYGGRVEVFRPRAHRGFAYDLNSAYPWALRETPVPVGDRIAVSGKRAARAFERGREGIYQVEVDVPPTFVPPLPARVGDRVLFPIGRIEGAWTRIELAHALEAGARVRRWSVALVWEDAATIAAPFMSLVWGFRKEAIDGGNAGLKEWHKLVANSLTGKLAQAPELETLVLCPEKIRTCDVETCRWGTRERCERERERGRCCRHRCWYSCGAHRPLDPKGKLWSTVSWRIPECGHVHWSAYLTAATRIELRRQLLADGEDGRASLYCDTDSVYSAVPRSRRLGDELGEWKAEGEVEDFRAIAPKVYRYDRDGAVTAKAKGLPQLTGEDFDLFERGEGITRKRGVKTLKVAAGGDVLFERRELTRQSHADGRWFGGRVLRADGRTYPVTIQEFRRGEKSRSEEGIPAP